MQYFTNLTSFAGFWGTAISSNSVNSLGTVYVNTTCLPPIAVTVESTTSVSNASSAGTIVGAVIGSVAGAIIIVAAIVIGIRIYRKSGEITTGRVVEQSDQEMLPKKTPQSLNTNKVMPFEVIPNHSVDEAGVTQQNYLETQEQRTFDNVTHTEMQAKSENGGKRSSKPK